MVYINGIDQDHQTNVKSSWTTPSGEEGQEGTMIYIGAREGGSDAASALVDELLIFTEQLSQSDIQMLVNDV